MNVRGANDIRQAEIPTAEPLVNYPSASEFDLSTQKLKYKKSAGNDQIPTDLFKAACSKFRHENINLLFVFVISRISLMCLRSRSLYVSVRSAIKQTVVMIKTYNF